MPLESRINIELYAGSIPADSTKFLLLINNLLCGVKHKLALLPSYALFHEVPHYALSQKCGMKPELGFMQKGCFPKEAPLFLRGCWCFQADSLDGLRGSVIGRVPG